MTQQGTVMTEQGSLRSQEDSLIAQQANLIGQSNVLIEHCDDTIRTYDYISYCFVQTRDCNTQQSTMMTTQ